MPIGSMELAGIQNNIDKLRAAVGSLVDVRGLNPVFELHEAFFSYLKINTKIIQHLNLTVMIWNNYFPPSIS